ncbi:MAG: hypothetical protein WCJ31_15210 [Planctomycetia bacterium]
MNRGEFNTWVKRHQTLFQNLSAWFEQQADARVILDAWAKALEHCTAAHAADATDRMLRGVPPLLEFNDWALLPSVVLQHCQLMGSGRPKETGGPGYAPGAMKALQKAFCEMAPNGDRETFRDFEALVEVMDPADLLNTKTRILDAVDEGRLGAQSAGDLLTSALKRAGAVRFGNPGTPRFASAGEARKGVAL